jgi:hypothetical protein
MASPLLVDLLRDDVLPHRALPPDLVADWCRDHRDQHLWGAGLAAAGRIRLHRPPQPQPNNLHLADLRLPPGALLHDGHCPYGQEIGVLTTAPLAALVPTEDLAPKRGERMMRYVNFASAGRTPPPVSVVEAENGQLRMCNGHHRYLAAQHLHHPRLPAHISPALPNGLRTAEGQPMLVTATVELATALTQAERTHYASLPQRQQHAAPYLAILRQYEQRGRPGDLEPRGATAIAQRADRWMTALGEAGLAPRLIARWDPRDRDERCLVVALPDIALNPAVPGWPSVAAAMAPETAATRWPQAIDRRLPLRPPLARTLRAWPDPHGVVTPLRAWSRPGVVG